MNLARPNSRRRISLTPMIDVVFLLLIFFMLVARFGLDGAVEVSLAGQGPDYVGPPRLVDVTATAQRLNGVDLGMPDLFKRLVSLTDSASDVIVLRSRDEADVQRIIDVMEALQRAGFTKLALIE